METPLYLNTEDPLAVAVVDAIHTGNLPALKRLLGEHPGLAQARLGDNGPAGMSRALLYVATDWPGTVSVPGQRKRWGEMATP